MALTIGIDVGGTKIAAGVVDEDGTIVATAASTPLATASRNTAMAGGQLAHAARTRRACQPFELPDRLREGT